MIERTTPESVIKVFNERYAELDGIIRLIPEMFEWFATIPRYDTHYRFCIANTELCVNDGEGYTSISGLYWKDILMTMCPDDLLGNNSIESLLSDIIYEMTYYGLGRDFCVFTGRDPDKCKVDFTEFYDE